MADVRGVRPRRRCLVLGAGDPRACRTRDPSHLCVNSACHLARTVDRPSRGGSHRRRFVLCSRRAWRLGPVAANEPSRRRPSALPVNILAKIADVRVAGKGGSVEKLQQTIEEITKDLGKSEAPKGTVSRPVVVTPETVAGFSGFAWLAPIVGPLGTAGLGTSAGHFHVAGASRSP